MKKNASIARHRWFVELIWHSSSTYTHTHHSQLHCRIACTICTSFFLLVFFWVEKSFFLLDIVGASCLFCTHTQLQSAWKFPHHLAHDKYPGHFVNNWWSRKERNKKLTFSSLASMLMCNNHTFDWSFRRVYLSKVADVLETMQFSVNNRKDKWKWTKKCIVMYLGVDFFLFILSMTS